MKPVIEESTKQFIRDFVSSNGKGYAEDEVMDNLFEIGAYYSWGEENYGKQCRDNTVSGFLEVLKALLEALNEKEIQNH